MDPSSARCASIHLITISNLFSGITGQFSFQSLYGDTQKYRYNIVEFQAEVNSSSISREYDQEMPQPHTADKPTAQ